MTYLKPKTLFHTFATDTYLPWAEMFLEGIRLQYGYGVDIRMDVYDVSEVQKNLLRHVYPLEIQDMGSGYRELAEQQGVSMDTVEEWRDQIAQGTMTDSNVPFKLFISVEKRYRGLYDVIKTARKKGYEYVIHSDVDIYFRKPLDEMFELMKDYDIGLYCRFESEHHRRKTLGAFTVFRLTDATESYLKQWMDEIDKVPKTERWAGFGQSTQYFAIKNTPEVRVADFYNLPKSPVCSRSFDESAHLWLNSNSAVPGKSGIGVDIARQRSWEDLKKQLPRIPLEESRGTWLNNFRVLLWRFKRSVRGRLPF